MMAFIALPSEWLNSTSSTLKKELNEEGQNKRCRLKGDITRQKKTVYEKKEEQKKMHEFVWPDYKGAGGVEDLYGEEDLANNNKRIIDNYNKEIGNMDTNTGTNTLRRME